MNDKYFDGNLFEELPADHFHKKVLDHATCIAANLMFDAAHPDHTGGVMSANAYHMMIALCEAGLAKLDEEGRGREPRVRRQGAHAHHQGERARAAPVRPTGERGRGDGRGIRGHHGRGANDWRR